MVSRTSLDCCKHFEISIEAPNQSIYRKSNQFSILNEEAYTILPKQKCTITFNVKVFTSIPTVCILTCDPYLLKQNIYHEITIINTGQNDLRINLYNNNNTPFIIRPFNFHVNCTVIAGAIETLAP